MRRRIVPAAVLLLLALSARGQQRGAIDWIFLVDTSKSMRGVGGNNIFPDVKASLDSFVREASDGDTVTLFTFDANVVPRASMDIRGAARDDLVTAVDSLEAEGKRTHLGLAIREGVKRAEMLRNRGDKTRVQSVVLFTDGKEDVRGIANPVPIAANLDRVDGTYVFFVSMGAHEHEEQLDDFARRIEHGTVLRAPAREAIRDVARRIRSIVAPPPAVVTLAPAVVDLGDVRRGKSAEAEIAVDAGRPVQVALQLVDAPRGITMQPQTVKTPARVRLHFDVAGEAEPGRGAFTLKAANATTRGTIDVTKPSPLRWLALLPVAALLAWLARSRYRKDHELEGELEILRPQVAPDAAFVGLPRLAASELALSRVVPPDALGGADARLFVRRHAGKKEVWIAASGGALRINDIETPTSALYDADTIAIGDATLRFNRAGHERTATPAEEEL